MEGSTPFVREAAMSQPCGSEYHEESHLPLFTDLTKILAMDHEAGATDTTSVAQTANTFDANSDMTKLAQVAFGYRPKISQSSDMESVKALLRDLLDDVQEMERSSYFDGLLAQWLDIWRRDRTNSLLIYVLGDRSKQYGNCMLDFNNLEAIDTIKTRVLEQRCLQQGACIHLAKMTSAVNTDPHNTLELKMAISLHDIRDLSGTLLGNKPVAVGKESILQRKMLEERYHQQLASQNAYPSPTETTPSPPIDTAKSFQDWVLLIMPEGYRFKFLTDNADPQALHEWINAQSADFQPSDTDPTEVDPNVRWGLTLACKTQMNNIGTWFASGSGCTDPEVVQRYSGMLDAVVCASLRLRDYDLFQQAVTWNPRMVSLTMWGRVGSMMELSHFSSYRNSLVQALSKINSLQDRYIILHDIRVGFESQNQPPEIVKDIDKWIPDQIEQALNEVERVEKNDGAVLVVVAKKFANMITVNRIISFAKKHSSNQDFAFELTFSLYDELVENTMDARFAKYALAEVISSAVPTLCVRGAGSRSLHQGFPSSAPFDTPALDQHTPQAHTMARLVRCCLMVGLYTEEHALLRYMWQGASIADASTLQHNFLPYLKQLLMVMQDHFIPLTTPSYQWQFQQIVSLFITRYIGKEPTPLPVDLACPPLGCAANPTSPYGCPTCLKLDAFLVDSHRKQTDVTGGIDAPEHIAAQIQGTDYLQMKVISHSAEQMRSTIQITKNMMKSEEPDARHDLWTERVVKANDLIQAICGDAEWKMLLGDKYDECMGLKAVRVG